MKRKVLKFLIPMALVLSISTPVFANTTDNNTDTNTDTNTDISATTHVDDLDRNGDRDYSKYKTFTGTITEVTHVEDKYVIKVEHGDEAVLFNIGDETQLLNASGMKVLTTDFAKDQEVSVFYGTNTTMTLSLPPQITPEVIVIGGSEFISAAKVDFFDEEGLSSDRNLRINISDTTTIVDLKGFSVPKENIANKNLIVFYRVETRSIPPQTTPEKIIVLNDNEVSHLQERRDVKRKELFENFISEDRYEKGDLSYVRLTTVTNALGFTAQWNEKTSAVTISHGNATYTLIIGEREYMYNHAVANFIAAPVIINNRTFVEESFIDKLIQLYK